MPTHCPATYRLVLGFVAASGGGLLQQLARLTQTQISSFVIDTTGEAVTKPTTMPLKKRQKKYKTNKMDQTLFDLAASNPLYYKNIEE